MRHFKVVFGLLTLIVLTQAFSRREKRLQWGAGSSSLSSRSGGPGGTHTKTHTHATAGSTSDAGAVALGGGYYGGQGEVSGGDPGLSQPAGGGHIRGGHGGFGLAGGFGAGNILGHVAGNFGLAHNVEGGHQIQSGYPGHPGQQHLGGGGNWNQGGHPGVGGNAKAAANAFQGRNPHFQPHGAPSGGNAIANANSYGSSNAITTANSGFGGSPFYSRVGKEADDEIKKLEGSVSDTKGVFSHGTASPGEDCKGKYETSAGKIPA